VIVGVAEKGEIGPVEEVVAEDPVDAKFLAQENYR